ncbi:MAG TPA: Na+/H+ antiporter NhaA [Acidimicrobiales bacterium]|nr:Na+/H+ antiporter NhaA [Acidimicrobiales bacterium]
MAAPMAIEDEPRVDAGDGDRSREVTPWTRRLAPVREFVATENASAAILLAATVAAIVWANSPWSGSYERFWDTEVALRFGSNELALDLRHWVNDGLMAFFFFVVGLEIRRELDMGELRERRRVATPVLAAIGGMVAPALIYLAVNAGESSARGWGIAMGTDTAFAIGILTLVGGAAPRVRSFLLTLVIVDDIVALAVIALAYTDDLSLAALGVAVGLYGVVLVLRASGVRHGVPYFLVGLGMWLATLASGVHATIAGVAVGLLATAYPPSRQQLSQAGTIWRLFREEPTPEYARTASRTLTLTISPNERLQHLFHPWTSYVIVPLFALANAGVELEGEVLREVASEPIVIGIVVGLVVGKPVGILGATWLASRPWLGGLPRTVTWPPLVGAATVAGIGFTVSLLIADITFTGRELEEAKLGILAASVIASLAAWIAFTVIRRLPRDGKAGAAGAVAPPIVDLAADVDPEVDHIRGPLDAPVTLVEYGDFECPYCGRAEPVVRELVRRFGGDLRFVFRHLPLVDVHEHAATAAEAGEAAAAQGRFWDMHDVLMPEGVSLIYPDLVRYAGELGLDVERFADDVRSRRHALRIHRDVASADASGAAGTPAFFINGRRHQGSHDADTLAAAIERELEACT